MICKMVGVMILDDSILPRAEFGPNDRFEVTIV